MNTDTNSQHEEKTDLHCTLGFLAIIEGKHNGIFMKQESVTVFLTEEIA